MMAGRLKPITMVAIVFFLVSALAPLVTKMPASSTAKGPSRATSSEPGMAAKEKSRTGRLASAPTAACDKGKLAWIWGITGGSASTVMRRQTPQSHNRTNALMPR